MTSYEEGEGGPFRPIVNNVEVADLTCGKSKYGVYLRGYKDAPIRGLTMSNCRFDNAEKGNLLEHVESIAMKNVRINGVPVHA